MKNPWKKILQNAKGGQSLNEMHKRKGINRRVKEFSITELDIEKIYIRQNGRSKWLNIPIDPMDVFKTDYPLSPSLDRIDNDKDYTPENICLSTRFENYGFNRSDDYTKNLCINKIIKSIRYPEPEDSTLPSLDQWIQK